jgi:hypothetical protein
MVEFYSIEKIKFDSECKQKGKPFELDQLSIFQYKELLNDIKKDVYY